MITVGITTYNRLETLKKMARSFYASEKPFPYSIKVYDDASTEYGKDVLREIFPDAVSIFRQPQNVGSDANIWYMYKDFFKSKDEIFFNADSDLLFSRDWMVRGVEMLNRSDGVLSIFNTSSHKTLQIYGDISEKEDIGSAGTFFKRDVLQWLIDGKADLEKNLENEGLDYQWCRYFRSMGIRLCVSSQSFVQHIGFDGYNSSMENFDYGVKFAVDSALNGQLINDALEEKFSQRIAGKKKYALFPFEKIDKGAKVVLYGAGMTGQDYIAQIKSSGYCDLVAVVDKNYETIEGVAPPEKLLELDFDYIVLATLRNDFIAEIENDIKRLSVAFGDKIVYKENGQTIRI